MILPLRAISNQAGRISFVLHPVDVQHNAGTGLLSPSVLPSQPLSKLYSTPPNLEAQGQPDSHTRGHQVRRRSPQSERTPESARRMTAYPRLSEGPNSQTIPVGALQVPNAFQPGTTHEPPQPEQPPPAPTSTVLPKVRESFCDPITYRVVR